DLGDDGGIVHDDGGRERRGSVVVGLLPGDLRARSRTQVECLQIRLSPVVAAAVLGDSGELTGNVATLDELWGRDAARFEDELRATPSWDQRFSIAADVLRRRLVGRRAVPPELAYAWRRTVTDRGRVRVEHLADEVGWSRQRLWSRFRSRFGITPKRALQLVRFDHAAHLLAAGRPVADVAVESGYVDQSHLHREVKAITGATPTVVASAPWLQIDDVAWPTGPP
ncbi:MAG TPA: helix-turn-helix domain-containing protein, partial [Actinopolymorphaceae bacterium]